MTQYFFLLNLQTRHLTQKLQLYFRNQDKYSYDKIFDEKINSWGISQYIQYIGYTRD